ncbi:MAG: hypothetical protein WCK01_02735 [Candidatus Uhrbacteria bacterium]
MDQVSLPTNWIKGWVGFGSVIFLSLVILPPYFLYSAQQDVQRYRDCIANKRADCKRTIVWNLVDVALQLQAMDNATPAPNLTAFSLTDNTGTTRPVRSSENSPTIEKVEPQGMSNENGTYRAASGSVVNFVATISGTVVSVEGFLIVDGKPSDKSAVVLKKQKDGTWQGAYKIPVNLKGEFEIRATGSDPKDRASLYLLVAVN